MPGCQVVEPSQSEGATLISRGMRAPAPLQSNMQLQNIANMWQRHRFGIPFQFAGYRIGFGEHSSLWFIWEGHVGLHGDKP